MQSSAKTARATSLSGTESSCLQAPACRRALSAFMVSGLLMSFVGAILPAWGYHLKADYTAIGYHFLGINLGLVASVRAGRALLARRGIRFTLVFGCMAAFAALLYLSFVPPPRGDLWRIGGLFVIGAAVGILNAAIFHAISPIYRLNPIVTLNLAGMFFGAGCFLMALLLAGTFNVYTVPSILFFVALVPGFFALWFARTTCPPVVPAPERSYHRAGSDLRSPVALLFSILLFFQFGNEWSIAGWLTLFLIQRLGLSPATSLLLLAAYWLALLLGRVLAQWLLPRVGHWRLLMGSAAGAMLGCFILALTNNRFGAGMGVLLVGFGFALVYPLTVERIGERFPQYHPGFFNGAFSIALIGGMLAPWHLSYAADLWGIRVVMLLPMAGTCIVFLLLVVMWIESRFGARQLSAAGAR
ncbi:MAG: MFS transporter [Acidobacteria bacterium]|nr:MFS transporter [Acidobacteriota bacterium]